MRFICRICCAMIALLFLCGISASSVAEDADPSYPIIELPPEFTAQYPGYTGIGELDTWVNSEEEAVYLACNEEGWLVLLCGVNHENAGWTVIESAPLPSGSCVVTEGGIRMLDLGHVRCSICRYHDDTWGIYMTGWYDCFIGPKWIGFRELLERQHYGKHPWGDLTSIDWLSLEGNVPDALQHLDTSGCAFPDQDNIRDMTAVYEAPDESSTAIASLINGAPLFVIETNDEWTHVCIGRDDGSAWKLDGWIRTNQLAFSEELSPDRFGMPDSILRAGRDSMITIITPDGQKTVTRQYYGSKEFFVIGEGTAGGMDCWLVYSAYTEEIGFVEKEALVDIS